MQTFGDADADMAWPRNAALRVRAHGEFAARRACGHACDDIGVRSDHNLGRILAEADGRTLSGSQVATGSQALPTNLKVASWNGRRRGHPGNVRLEVVSR